MHKASLFDCLHINFLTDVEYGVKIHNKMLAFPPAPSLILSTPCKLPITMLVFHKSNGEYGVKSFKITYHFLFDEIEF